MYTNFHLSRDAKKKLLTAYLDISGTTPLFEVIFSRTSSIRIRAIDLVYAIATDGGTRPENIRVGIPGTLTKFANVNPAASQAVGTVVAVTPASADLIPKGVPLIITRSAVSGGTNTGEVALVVEYQFEDGDYMP